MKTINISIDPNLSIICQSFCNQSHKPTVQSGLVRTNHFATYLYINELIPLEGSYQWNFSVQKLSNLVLFMVGISKQGCILQSKKQIQNLQDDSIFFMPGTGGKKYKQNQNGFTQWQIFGKKIDIETPFLVTFQIDRKKQTIRLLFNRKEYEILPLTQKMNTCRLQPRINLFEKNAQIMLNPKYCATCIKISDNLSVCGKCKKVKYCGRDCQKKDWSEHKLICIA